MGIIRGLGGKGFVKENVVKNLMFSVMFLYVDLSEYYHVYIHVLFSSMHRIEL